MVTGTVQSDVVYKTGPRCRHNLGGGQPQRAGRGTGEVGDAARVAGRDAQRSSVTSANA